VITRDKSPVVESVKTRIKESLTNYIKQNDKKTIEAHFNQITDQYECRLEKLHDNFLKEKDNAER
jgi:bifunctional pyridoxal-dependent enzyme with beta-cystathionase and maltose regulon repressor activities